jgi:hypothetical protein
VGQILQGRATTTAAIHRAIQNSQASLRELSRRYGINQKTVTKWKKRTCVVGLPTGPTQPKSTVLTIEDEVIIEPFRRYTLLPLDDCLYALQPTIPHLRPSSLHRCQRRHGISRPPEVKCIHYDRHRQLQGRLTGFISAYNFGRRLKTVEGLTPYEFICKIWTKEPDRFKLNPIHQMPGLT